MDSDDPEPAHGGGRSRRASGSGPLFAASTTVLEPLDSLAAAAAAVNDGSNESEIPYSILDDAAEDVKVDLRSLDYVSSVDAHLVCPICQSPFVEPVQLECDHSFCKQCLLTSYETTTSASIRPCPMCRKPNSKQVPHGPPRYVTRLLDELVAYCPHRRLGCEEKLERGNVHGHIVKQCGFTEVRCRTAGCGLAIARRDAEKECLHKEVECEHCSSVVMERDLQKHKDEECPGYTERCPCCGHDIRKKLLAAHVKDVCPDTTTGCPGASYGCTFSGKRAETDAHATDCPVAKMAPFLEKQRRELEDERAAREAFQRKIQIFEGGLSSIQEMLYSAPSAAVSGPSTDDGRRPRLDLATTPSPGSPDRGLPAGPEAPFDTPIQHVLSLHEALREELSRLENTMAEHEARTTMMMINEGQRQREEQAHANAAINTMRAQLHWLLSSRLQLAQAQRGRVGAAPPAPGASGGSEGAGAGAGAGEAPSTSVGLGSVRRMSGQDTKL